MKTAVISLVLASVLLACAAALVLYAKSGSAPASESARVDSAGAQELAQLAERVERLERALQVLTERGGRSASSAAGNAEGDVPERGPEASGGASELTAANDAAGAALPEGSGRNELRELVRQVIADERSERQERSRKAAETRMREFEELGKGPYGKYNRRVNTLAGKLNLHESQAQRYHELLAKYDTQAEELRRGVAMTDPEARRKYREDYGKIETEFNEQARLLLDGAQLEAYEKLHAFETSLATAGGGGGFLSVAVDGGDGEADVMVSPMTLQVDGADGAVEIIGGAAGGVAIPLPPPQPSVRVDVAPAPQK